MPTDLLRNNEYKVWLADIKSRIRNVQIKAALKVSTELLSFYWELGADIVARQEKTSWGDGFLLQLSKDLMAEFPEMKGFSRRNLELIRKWYLYYSNAILPGQIAKQSVSQLSGAHEKVQNKQDDGKIGQQVVSQITSIPWGHNIVIITKCKKLEEALYYVQNTMRHNWSRSVLVHQIESGLYQRDGTSINNFTLTLPKEQSDLAIQTLKDPYVFDFLSMTRKIQSSNLEE